MVSGFGREWRFGGFGFDYEGGYFVEVGREGELWRGVGELSRMINGELVLGVEALRRCGVVGGGWVGMEECCAGVGAVV